MARESSGKSHPDQGGDQKPDQVENRHRKCGSDSNHCAYHRKQNFRNDQDKPTLPR
jgi:hypothetical protein